MASVLLAILSLQWHTPGEVRSIASARARGAQQRPSLFRANACDVDGNCGTVEKSVSLNNKATPQQRRVPGFKTPTGALGYRNDSSSLPLMSLAWAFCLSPSYIRTPLLRSGAAAALGSFGAALCCPEGEQPPNPIHSMGLAVLCRPRSRPPKTTTTRGRFEGISAVPGPGRVWDSEDDLFGSADRSVLSSRRPRSPRRLADRPTTVGPSDSANVFGPPGRAERTTLGAMARCRLGRSWDGLKVFDPDTPWDCHRTADQLGWCQGGQWGGIGLAVPWVVSG